MTCGSPTSRVADFHLLGQVDYERCLQLQRRLAYEAASDNSARMVVLLCEHPALITVGCSGSRAHIRWTNEQLRREGLKTRWVQRSGGCILHAPGQLAVYPILSLASHGWHAEQFIARLQASLQTALARLLIATSSRADSHGVWGRSGLLAAFGLSLRQGVASHGVYVNVNPAMQRFGFIDTAPAERLIPGQRSTMSCLFAECRQPVRMPQVRAAVIERMVDAFELDRHHIHSGHVWLPRPCLPTDTIARAS